MDVREETTRLRGWFELTADPNEAGKSLVKLWEAKAWEEYGHASWRDYCEAEFPVKPKWHKDIRRTLVGIMSAAGMSQRDMAVTLDVDQKTISNDLANSDLESKVKPRPGLDKRVAALSTAIFRVQEELDDAAPEDLAWAIGPTLVKDLAEAFGVDLGSLVQELSGDDGPSEEISSPDLAVPEIPSDIVNERLQTFYETADCAVQDLPGVAGDQLRRLVESLTDLADQDQNQRTAYMRCFQSISEVAAAIKPALRDRESTGE